MSIAKEGKEELTEAAGTILKSLMGRSGQSEEGYNKSKNLDPAEQGSKVTMTELQDIKSGRFWAKSEQKSKLFSDHAVTSAAKIN